MPRFEIFLSPGQPEDQQRALAPAGRFGRVKGVLTALLVAAAFIAFLMVALVIGSILAVAVVVILAVAFTAALFKKAIERAMR